MEVIIYKEPCWLLEAAELVYSLVNGIPATKLAGSGPHCIPPEDVARIQAIACATIDPEDELVQYYFQGVPLEGFSGRLSCLGCVMLYSSLPVGCSRPEDYAAFIREAWRTRMDSGFHVDGIDGFTLSLEPAEGKPMSLAKELSVLQAPELYKMQLLEVFSAFDQHLEQLARLLTPVAEALPELMAPWVKSVSALAKEWETFFRLNSPQEFFLHRARMPDVSTEKLEIAFRFLSPGASPGKYSEDRHHAWFHLGVSMEPSLESPGSAQSPEEWELTAVRLMANSARMEMLRLMMERPMSGQELAQKLNLNSGSVFRDLNSLYNARLLLQESNGSRNYYRTNMSTIRQITEHLVNHIQSGTGS
ncbi:MAG: winged helix-turn-helix domain-containing protein [Faecousia sp.]